MLMNLVMIMILLILLIMVLISVAFLTLLERKMLGYIQIRKGPNKVGYLGILQPFSDAIKLFSKEMVIPYMSNNYIFLLSPIFSLIMALFLWLSMPFYFYLLKFDFSVMFFFCISSLAVYMIMMSGWSSNSNYSLLGSLRSVAQTISYEVSMFIILISFLMLTLSLNFFDFFFFQKFIWFMILNFPLSLMWLISSLAETNRTPFDFAEGESELVSGFNIEYSGFTFAFIFMSEYSNILFMSMLVVLIFMGGNFFSLFFFLKLTFLSMMWVWIRGTFPRYRYDKLMYLSWKVYLPVSLNFLLMNFSMSLFILMNLI